MTKRLYYEDSHICEFEASVLSCEKTNGGFAIKLDKTAFFPGGGGQEPDGGEIAGMPAISVQEESGNIFHILRSPLPVGSAVKCSIDRDTRLRRMQNHSGEHIVSGLVNRLYGFNNVGFHMGHSEVTIDFDGYLGKDELLKIETLANEAVAKNLSVTTLFPSPGELKKLEYRSKLDLTENVRIVTIEDTDVCACCAPHVKRTGEVGIIKILDAIRHDGGVRVSVLCGLDALDDYRKKCGTNSAISALLSAKPDETDAAVKRLYDENEENKRSIAELKTHLADIRIGSLTQTGGNICVFEQDFDTNQLRRVVNAGMALCTGICAAFSGSDEAGYQYVMGSRNTDMRTASKKINAALSGRGGGRPEMIQGSVSSKRRDIEDYFSAKKICLN
ncbi:MAG: alanyl-tRNA editing protein [Oscillospiraceae bacterium]